MPHDLTPEVTNRGDICRMYVNKNDNHHAPTINLTLFGNKELMARVLKAIFSSAPGGADTEANPCGGTSRG